MLKKSCVSGRMRILTWSSNVTSAKSPFSQAPGFIIISSINCAYKALVKENIKRKVNGSSDKNDLSTVHVKPVLSGHLKRRPKLVFKTDYRLIQVKTIAKCSKGSILQYFRPSLGYHCH